MKVVLNHAAEIARRNLDDRDRDRVDAWVGHLKNWEADADVKKRSRPLDGPGNKNVYLLRTSTDLRMFFVLHAKHIEVVDIARQRFTAESGESFVAAANRMKSFVDVSFSADHCKRELDDLGKLLKGKDTLKERNTIRPFFQARRQLSAFIGTYIPDIGPANLVSHEFKIVDDFVADLVVGNPETQTYCMVEFEEAGSASILATAGKKSTKEWSRRFEHGFSQLVDWFYALDDLKQTHKFRSLFGDEAPHFSGLLVIGRSAGLSGSDRHRLRWRGQKVLVNSHQIICVTFDDLHEDLSRRLRLYMTAAEG